MVSRWRGRAATAWVAGPGLCFFNLSWRWKKISDKAVAKSDGYGKGEGAAPSRDLRGLNRLRNVEDLLRSFLGRRGSAV